MHYSGNNEKAWTHVFEKTGPQTYRFWQGGAYLFVEAEMTTHLLSQGQLDDVESAWVVVHF